MKGLLLKDLYMLRAYCKSYLLIVAVFLASSFWGGNTFFVYYPCLICGMIPVNLLAYDEQSRFIQYSVTLPVSKSQFVSEKYLMGLFAQAAVLIVTGTVQAVKMKVNGDFNAKDFFVIMMSLLIVSLLASSVPMPLIFKNGVVKGRLTYYVMIGIVCVAGFIFSDIFDGSAQIDISTGLLFSLLIVIGAAIYALSWYLSIVFYRKREL